MIDGDRTDNWSDAETAAYKQWMFSSTEPRDAWAEGGHRYLILILMWALTIIFTATITEQIIYAITASQTCTAYEVINGTAHAIQCIVR